jgi:hypothetical protein
MNKLFDEGRVLQNFSISSTQLIDMLLSLLHALDVIIKR